mmetsp:Transcript_108/g.184  ORF Transcript_108/g.184 Transcript_108/m.184 type:complete len:182 (-) Transcript_108:66-611(-)
MEASRTPGRRGSGGARWEPTGVIAAMEEAGVERVVTISSVGINGDRSWPHPASKFSWRVSSKRSCEWPGMDLKAMEDAYARSSLDYLIVPAGGHRRGRRGSGRRYYLQVSGEDAVGGQYGEDGRCAVHDRRGGADPLCIGCSQTVGSKHGTRPCKIDRRVWHVCTISNTCSGRRCHPFRVK